MGRSDALTIWSKVLICLFVLALGCAKDKDVVPTVIPADFSDYVSRFVQEGKTRNVQVDVSRLTVEFVSQTSGNYCGQSLTANAPHVVIMQTGGCWTSQSDLNKEILMFHELGHALLKRNHFDDEFPSGLWKSMMHSGNQFEMYSEFAPQLRSYYLDELFNPAVVPPSGISSVKSNSSEVLKDSITANTVWVYRKTVESLAHSGTLSGTVFSSPSHALAIQSSDATTATQFSYWVKGLSPVGIAVGSQLVMKAKVKLVDVTGTGVSVAIRGDSGNKTAFFRTSQNVISIKGSQDFVEYTIKLGYMPDKVDVMYIFLILLPQSTGAVYFDDVQLTNNF